MDLRSHSGAVTCITLLGLCLGAKVHGDSQPWNVEVVGQMGGWCLDVQVVGHYAYVSEALTLTILDVSDLPQPRPIGRAGFDDFYALDIQVQEDIAYLAGGSFYSKDGLQILDVADSMLPRALSFYPTPFLARGVYVVDDVAYVACGDGSQGALHVVDVSDPTSPALLGAIDAGPYPEKVYVAGGTAYVATYRGLLIVDVTDPYRPKRLGLYSQTDCQDVLTSAGLAYVAWDNGLDILDMSDPFAPKLCGRIEDFRAWGMSLLPGLVFLACPSGLRIVDVTDPTSPTLVGFLRTSGKSDEVVISNKTAYLADRMGGLCIIDVTDPSSPTLRAIYDTLSDAQDIYVVEGLAYVANGVRGLRTIDISDPRSPRFLGSLPVPGAANKVFVAGKKAYVCDNSGDTPETRCSFVHIVDITTPSSPTLLGSYVPAETYVENVAVSGDLAYVATIEELHIVDVTNPASPTLRATFPTPGWECDVFISGDLAFIADFTSLQIVDVSNPTSPVLRSSFPGWRIAHVFVSDSVAYVTGVWPEGDFACIDISNPDAPRLLGMYDLSGFSYEAAALFVCDGLAYVILDHLRVIDVSDPTSPTLCGFYPTVSSIFGDGVFACGDVVYVVDISGLKILQFTGRTTAAPHWRAYR